MIDCRYNCEFYELLMTRGPFYYDGLTLSMEK